METAWQREMGQGTPERQGEKLSQERGGKNSICRFAHCLPLSLSSKWPSLSQNSNEGYSRGSNFCIVSPPPGPEEDLKTLAKRTPADISKSTGKEKKTSIHRSSQCVPSDTEVLLTVGTLMRMWPGHCWELCDEGEVSQASTGTHRPTNQWGSGKNTKHFFFPQRHTQ